MCFTTVLLVAWPRPWPFFDGGICYPDILW